MQVAVRDRRAIPCLVAALVLGRRVVLRRDLARPAEKSPFVEHLRNALVGRYLGDDLGQLVVADLGDDGEASDELVVVLPDVVEQQLAEREDLRLGRERAQLRDHAAV